MLVNNEFERLNAESRAVLLAALGPRAHLEMPWMQHSTPAGFPSGAADFDVDRLDLAQMLHLDEPFCFMSRVSGRSMIGVGIEPGDLIVINRSLTPTHDDIIVAVLDNEVTLKTLYQKHGVTKLVPANPEFPEIVLKEGQTLEVWGVLTASVKLFGRKE
jgi:DNA polymerase V